jgi:hypothetical protein
VDNPTVHKVGPAKKSLKRRGDTAILKGTSHKKRIESKRVGQRSLAVYIKQYAPGGLSDSPRRSPCAPVFGKIDDQIRPCPFIGNRRDILPRQGATRYNKQNDKKATKLSHFQYIPLAGSKIGYFVTGFYSFSPYGLQNCGFYKLLDRQSLSPKN